MSFRRHGEVEHREQKSWVAWREANAELLADCGLPPGVLRSRRDWEYLLQNGFWCEDFYGSHVGNVDFELSELGQTQRDALRTLLDRTLSVEEKRRGCAAWHHFYPPPTH